MFHINFNILSNFTSFQNPFDATRKDLTLPATLPILATFPVAGTDNYLLREYNFKSGDNSKLDYYDGEGNLLWQVSKPGSFLNVIAISHNQAAVTWRMQTEAYGRGPTEVTGQKQVLESYFLPVEFFLSARRRQGRFFQ